MKVITMKLMITGIQRKTDKKGHAFYNYVCEMEESDSVKDSRLTFQLDSLTFNIGDFFELDMIHKRDPQKTLDDYNPEAEEFGISTKHN